MMMVPFFYELYDRGMFMQCRTYTLICTIVVYEISCGQGDTEWLVYSDFYSKDLHSIFSVTAICWATFVLLFDVWTLKWDNDPADIWLVGPYVGKAPIKRKDLRWFDYPEQKNGPKSMENEENRPAKMNSTDPLVSAPKIVADHHELLDEEDVNFASSDEENEQPTRWGSPGPKVALKDL